MNHVILPWCRRYCDDTFRPGAYGRLDRARADGLKTFSDLDLAFAGRLTAREHGDLVEAFDESLLPIKVDIVEMDALSPDFAQRIARDFVMVQDSGAVIA